MYRILTDQDFDEDIIRGLIRRRGAEIDWTPVRSFGYEEAEDSVVLDLALREDRILLTHDARTLQPLVYRLLASERRTAKVVVVPQTLPIQTAIEELLIILVAGTDEDWQGPFRLPL